MSTDWKPRVVEYYEKTFWDYFLVYFRGGNFSMNYGYRDKSVQSRNESYARLYERTAGALSLQPGDRVMDAGCGLGEAACFMATRYGCRVTGVTISPTQVSKAQEIVEGRNLHDRVSVDLTDYTKTNYPDGSFDAIYAIETICKTLLAGWAIPNLWTSEAHGKALNQYGFAHVQIEDYSFATIPVARYLYWYSLFGIPIYRVLLWLGLIDDVRMQDALSCRYQWLTKQRGLWGHAFITARKR